MIKIDFVEPTTQQWKDWLEQCSEEQKKVIDQFGDGEKPDIKSRIYKGEKFNIKEDVFVSETGPFMGKCAFCEKSVSSTQYVDIDHYRPKADTTDEDGVPVVVDIGDGNVAHPGYYWLCYEWKNLLPSCELCNRPTPESRSPSKSGKQAKFPVSGFRASRPGEEVRESPVLLNPCIDEPDDHLYVDETGEILPKTTRGDISIRILGLNERGLPSERRKVFKDTLKSITLWKMKIRENPDVDTIDIGEIEEEWSSSELTATRHAAIREYLRRSAAADDRIAKLDSRPSDKLS